MKEETKKNILIISLVVIIILLVALLVVVITKKDNKVLENKANYITSNEALQVALDEEDIKKSDIKDLDIELDYKYNKDVYDVSFSFDGYEYEFYIDAVTKDIIKAFKERDDDVITNTDSNNTSNNGSNNTTNNETQNNKYISRDKALSTALEHAGVKQSEIYDIDIELDYKFGKQVYEVSFNYQSYEYEYYIDATTSDVLHSFKEWD